jgi:class 3 adenylate cyclase
VADALPESSAIPALEIAHVLFMDIVAYSKLPMDRQQQVLHDLQDAVRSTSTFIRAAPEDQLIRLPTGDGMALVFFEDPEAPVRCALELAKVLRGDPHIELRMGIHTGPVYRVADINMNRNVAGGGINTAQRVMDCGDAGHILVSSTSAEILSQLSAWSPMLHDLGEVPVKHGIRVHLYNLYAAGAGSPRLPSKVGSGLPTPLTVLSRAGNRRLALLMLSIVALLVVMEQTVSWITQVINWYLEGVALALLSALHIQPSHPETPIPEYVVMGILVLVVATVLALLLRSRLSVERRWQGISKWLGRRFE